MPREVTNCGVPCRPGVQSADREPRHGGCGQPVEHPDVVLVRCPDDDYLFHIACAPPRVPMFRRGLEAERQARVDRALPA